VEDCVAGQALLKSAPQLLARLVWLLGQAVHTRLVVPVHAVVSYVPTAQEPVQPEQTLLTVLVHAVIS